MAKLAAPDDDTDDHDGTVPATFVTAISGARNVLVYVAPENFSDYTATRSYPVFS